MMKHLDAEYYVALLSAAGFYGASHQKPMVFQVITNRRIKHSLTFGQVYIKLIHTKSLTDLPIKNFIGMLHLIYKLFIGIINSASETDIELRSCRQTLNPSTI